MKETNSGQFNLDFSPQTFKQHSFISFLLLLCKEPESLLPRVHPD